MRFFRSASSCNTRGHGYKLFTEQSTHNVCYHSFARCVVGRGIDFRPMLIFPLSLVSRLFLIVQICLIFCYIVLIRVDVSVPSGTFLSLAVTVSYTHLTLPTNREV